MKKSFKSSGFNCYTPERYSFLRRALNFIDAVLHPIFRKKIDTAKIKKILILRQDRIGDTVNTTPVFRALKEKFPESIVHVIISPDTYPVIKNNPFVDKIIQKKLDWFSYKIGPSAVKRTADLFKSFFDGSFFSLLKEIRKEKYDLIIDCVGKRRNAALCALSGAKYSIGCNFMGGSFLFSQMITPQKNKNHVYQVFGLLKPLGITGEPERTEIFLDKDSEKEKDGLCRGLNIDKNKIKITVHIGFSNVRARQWKKDNWVELIKKISTINNAQILLVYTDFEKGLAREILAQTRDVKNIIEINKLRLEELFLLLSVTDYLVCIESGAMHMAAALSIPTVVLFNGENPAVWAPFGNRSVVLRKLDGPKCLDAGCNNPLCINAIEPDEVYEALKKLMY